MYVVLRVIDSPVIGQRDVGEWDSGGGAVPRKNRCSPNRWHGVAGWSRRMQWLDVSRDPKIASLAWIALQVRVARLDARTAKLFVDLGELRIDVR